MASNWTEKKISEISYINDKSLSSNDKLEFINYLDTSNITDNKIDEIKHLVFAKDEIPSRAKRIVNCGDIVYSTVRPNQRHFGMITDLKKNMIVSTGFTVIRGKELIAETGFIYRYLTQSHIIEKLQIIAEHSVSAYPSIKPSDIGSLDISLPSYGEQKKIADFFDKIDEKIALNIKTNQTIEAFAQAIFKSWFVDFDPVKAKQQGGDLDIIAEELGMSRTILDLFPDELEESEIGLIPKGWKVKKLSDQIEIIGGGTPKRAESRFWNGDICWFSVKDVPDDCDVFVIDTHEKITDFGLQKSSTKLLPVGTTIITARGTVGKLALTGVPMAMNQSCYGVTGKKTGQYLNYFNLKNAVDILRRNTHGAIFDTITTDTFQTVLAVESVDNINAIFENKISSIMDKVKNNLFENQALIQLRDTLLPKLLSGEITIESAEEQIN
jgi:type I restriction enzyme S subunit